MSKEDNRVRFTFRMPDTLFEELKRRAEKVGVSTNALILQILWDWADQNQKKVG